MSIKDWIWSPDLLKDTPARQRGITKEVEAKLRREGIKILWEIGSALRLKANPTLATAGVYFHRFYMFHSFHDFPREITALGCLFLAGKVEETPKKCRDVCNIALQKFPSLYAAKQKTLIDETFGVERVLLQTMKFDLQVEHPYKYILQYADKMKLPKEVARGVVQHAWTFVNDSCSTMLCLSFEPQVIAVAMLYLAAKLNTSASNNQGIWWDDVIANLSVDLIDQICHRVLDFYTVSKVEKMDFMPPREVTA